MSLSGVSALSRLLDTLADATDWLLTLCGAVGAPEEVYRECEQRWHLERLRNGQARDEAFALQLQEIRGLPETHGFLCGGR